MADGRVPAAATWGLFVAWAVHDTEELFTMGGWMQRARPRLRARFPRVPEAVWDKIALTPAQARVAIGAVGVVMAVAAADGARTRGRSRLYQAALVGFGLHAAGHVAQAVAARGYTPGLVSAPVVVAPFSAWAWRRLGAAGVPRDGSRGTLTGLLLLPATVGAAHGLARALATPAARPTRAAAAVHASPSPRGS